MQKLCKNYAKQPTIIGNKKKNKKKREIKVTKPVSADINGQSLLLTKSTQSRYFFIKRMP